MQRLAPPVVGRNIEARMGAGLVHKLAGLLFKRHALYQVCCALLRQQAEVSRYAGFCASCAQAMERSPVEAKAAAARKPASLFIAPPKSAPEMAHCRFCGRSFRIRSRKPKLKGRGADVKLDACEMGLSKSIQSHLSIIRRVRRARIVQIGRGSSNGPDQCDDPANARPAKKRLSMVMAVRSGRCR